MSILLSSRSRRAAIAALATMAVCCFTALTKPAHAVTIEMVTVGDPGNANDTTGFGGVNYSYQIGKYDVTIGQYTDFLNAVAATDTYSLYSVFMGNNPNTAGIAQAGSPGSYTYSVMGSSANKPITPVTWFQAARFANWMANGQPTGAESSTTTENGAYTLNGANSGNAVAKNATNPNSSAAPTFYIPTQNEWYKAAYYSPEKGGVGSPGYYTYATQSDTAPGNVVGPGANQANYPIAGKYSVTQASYSPSQNYLTDVGAFTNSASFYGTFDQSGNVGQWNDLDGAAGSNRQVRGGTYSAFSPLLLSSLEPPPEAPSAVIGGFGFRLASPYVAPASVPEIDPAGIGSVLAMLGGVVGMLEQRRFRRKTLIAA